MPYVCILANKAFPANLPIAGFRFKDYISGYIHIDIKYLPKMVDEYGRKYLFVAIDRATRWVFMEIMATKSSKSAESFLKNLVKKIPFTITKILTDNGKEFTDRFCATGQRKPTGNHVFDKQCKNNKIEHRLTKPRTPQTNGMVERFNGRISEVVRQARFTSAQQLKEVLSQYCRLYNHNIPQKNLNHLSPVQNLKSWAKTHLCPRILEDT
jgi:transposase InsO family protein